MKCLLFLFIFFAVAEAQVQVRHLDSAQHAQELLAQARSVLGISNINSLSAEGKVHRTIKYIEVVSPTKIREKEKTLTSKLQLDLSLPDKFRAREKGTNINGLDYDVYAFVNGKEAWLYPLPVTPSIRNNRAVVSVEDAEQNFVRQSQVARASISRYTLSLLLGSFSAVPFEFSYVGSTSADNNTFDVISTRDLEGYRSLLWLDLQNHLPVMLNETTVLPQTTTVIATGFGFDRRFNRALVMRAREERQARARPPQPVSIQIRFSDRRNVEGLMLPYRITTFHNGQQVEEIEFKEFTINRPINPRKFDEKKPQ